MRQAPSVTYMPASQMFISGSHEEMPPGAALLATQTETVKEYQPEYHTRMSNHLTNLMGSVLKNRHKILLGQLSAADYQANRDNIDHLTLIRLFQQIRAEQEEYFWLDNMYETQLMDKLLLRMPFMGNPAHAQKVPPRQEFDTTKVPYDEVEYLLEKAVVSYDIPIEEPLRALISPVIPLQKSTKWSLKYLREQDALKGLQNLKYHYTKGAATKNLFTATSTPGDTGLISDPAALTTGNFHSDHKVVNEIQYARNAFLKQNDVILSHFAMSPQTAMEIAQNTWTDPNTINNVEAYRTNGGVRPFPGLSGATAVISLACPDDVIYAVAKYTGVMTKGEGPKITKTWYDENRWTTQTATADFYQYKCAHEDLTMDRKFGVIFDLASA